MSPPRCPVPRPSSRSCERKRTCWRMRSPSTDLIAARAAAVRVRSVADTLLLALVLGALFCCAAKTETTKISGETRLRINRFCMVGFYSRRPRDSVLRTSTGLEVEHRLVLLEDLRRRNSGQRGRRAAQFL